MVGKRKGAGFMIFCSPSSLGFGMQVSLGQEGCKQAAGLFLSSSSLPLLPTLKLALLTGILGVVLIHPTTHISFRGLCWNQLLLDKGSNNVIFHMALQNQLTNVPSSCRYVLSHVPLIYLQRRPLLKAGQGGQDLVKAWY